MSYRGLPLLTDYSGNWLEKNRVKIMSERMTQSATSPLDLKPIGDAVKVLHPITEDEAASYLKICKNGYEKALSENHLSMAIGFRNEMTFWDDFMRSNNEHSKQTTT